MAVAAPTSSKLTAYFHWVASYGKGKTSDVQKFLTIDHIMISSQLAGRRLRLIVLLSSTEMIGGPLKLLSLVTTTTPTNSASRNLSRTLVPVPLVIRYGIY